MDNQAYLVFTYLTTKEKKSDYLSLTAFFLWGSCLFSFFNYLIFSATQTHKISINKYFCPNYSKSCKNNRWSEPPWGIIASSSKRQNLRSKALLFNPKKCRVRWRSAGKTALWWHLLWRKSFFKDMILNSFVLPSQLKKILQSKNEIRWSTLCRAKK